MNRQGHVKLVRAMYKHRLPTNADIEGLITVEIIALLNENIHSFSKREIDILHSYYGINEHHKCELLREIAERYGLSVERIRQIREKSLRKLMHPRRTRLLWDTLKTAGFKRFV